MSRRALAALAGVALAHWGLPYLAVQLGNLGLLRRGRGAGHAVALTFDDGPDPTTTPAVLAALEQAGVRATFFVSGQAAAQHPELLRQMVAAGHDIGSHGFCHRHGWLVWPHRVKPDIEKAVQTIEQHTGEKLRWHRPPHGAYTLAHLLALRSLGLQGVHWTVEAHDWQAGMDEAGLQQRLLALRPGGIVVLHDAGAGGALTAAALPALLHSLTARGFGLVPLRELPSLRPEQLRDWPPRLLGLVDRSYDRVSGARPVGHHAGNLLRLSVAPLPASIQTHKGFFEAGTPALELHVDSARMAELAAAGKLKAARVIAHELKRAVQAAADDPEWSTYRLMFSVGTFELFLQRLGFVTTDLPAPMARRLSLWSALLRWAHGAQSGEREPPLRLSVLMLSDGLVPSAGAQRA